jgi:trimethylamine--corrinoid protein Co-methyltransferase
MQTKVQVLSDDERILVHELTLDLLSTTGLRVDTDRGRRILEQAGAQVEETTSRVCFPRSLVETALQAAPPLFTLGGRRPGWSFALNRGDCTLLADGGAVFAFDSQTNENRLATFEDWRTATRLIDALDEVGIYWAMVQPTFSEGSFGNLVSYWANIFKNFSKHVQDCPTTPEGSRWMLEVLQIVFNDKEIVRRVKPVSFLLNPFSPLVIEAAPTDAYLETIGWDIPVAVMPMPMMGSTAPASLISTLVQANCEALAVLCLVQSAAPGTPFLYAPAPVVMDPRSGRFTGGEVEHALLGAAVTEMGRFYNLPVQSSTGGSSSPVPGLQDGYERTLNWVLPNLSWPDILVGPGLLGGSLSLCLEQLLVDVEVFRRNRRLHEGINTAEAWRLTGENHEIGPGGNFLSRRSTRLAVHQGEWYNSRLGVNTSFEGWQAEGKPELLPALHAEIERILADHQPLSLAPEVEQELSRIEQHARELG